MSSERYEIMSVYTRASLRCRNANNVAISSRATPWLYKCAHGSVHDMFGANLHVLHLWYNIQRSRQCSMHGAVEFVPLPPPSLYPGIFRASRPLALSV